jgi:hypothetical protein
MALPQLPAKPLALLSGKPIRTIDSPGTEIPGFADAGSMRCMTDASQARTGVPARLMLTDQHAPKYGRALPRTGADTQHHNAGRPVLQGFADSIG